MSDASVCEPDFSLILTRREIAALMGAHDYLEAVQDGFRALAAGHATIPSPMSLAVSEGAFHVKGARLRSADEDFVAVKLNANIPGNPERRGLPTIQGALLLCDGVDGRVLAIMDSIEITARRTAAASALAAGYLARPEADTIAICGCGEQGRAHLAALAAVLPVACARAWDADPDRAQRFAHEMSAVLGFPVEPVADLGTATRASGVIVTATTARTPFLGPAEVPAGAFIAAVGADSPDKSELAPEVMAHATIVVDLLAQCVVMGDLHHAIEAGFVTPADVHAELGELVGGRKAGRTRRDEVMVFDSTGTAVQDVASAVRIYRHALLRHVGSPVHLNAR